MVLYKPVAVKRARSADENYMRHTLERLCDDNPILLNKVRRMSGDVLKAGTLCRALGVDRNKGSSEDLARADYYCLLVLIQQKTPFLSYSSYSKSL